MADMIRELRTYDPKPGLKYGGERPASVTPDVFVMPQGKGWAIEINGATLPRVLVNRRYHSQLAVGARDKTAKAWLSIASPAPTGWSRRSTSASARSSK